MSTTSLFSTRNLFLLLIGIGISRFIQHNPLLFRMRTTDVSADDFSIVREHPVLDAVLQQHSVELGDDYEAYRNHCLRVLSFAVHHLDGDKDETPDERSVGIIAYALAYHDLGLWTANALSYLDPSVAIMEQETKERQKNQNADDESDSIIPIFTEAEMELAKQIILQHRKITDWVDGGDGDEGAAIVNAVRKADWADATMGIVRYGLPASNLQAAYDAIPEAGFHAVLVGMGKRLSPDSVFRRLDVLRIFKW
jgi:hypothetical protein